MLKIGKKSLGESVAIGSYVAQRGGECFVAIICALKVVLTFINEGYVSITVCLLVRSLVFKTTARHNIISNVQTKSILSSLEGTKLISYSLSVHISKV